MHTQRGVAKWIQVCSRQHTHGKIPYLKTNKCPEEYVFWTISTLSPFPTFLFYQSYITWHSILYIVTLIQTIPWEINQNSYCSSGAISPPEAQISVFHLIINALNLAINYVPVVLTSSAPVIKSASSTRENPINEISCFEIDVEMVIPWSLPCTF